MGEETRITGGNKRKIRKRRAPRGAFTAARRQVFLDHFPALEEELRALVRGGGWAGPGAEPR